MSSIKHTSAEPAEELELVRKQWGEICPGSCQNELEVQAHRSYALQVDHSTRPPVYDLRHESTESTTGVMVDEALLGRVLVQASGISPGAWTEADTKRVVIEPVLTLLGWDVTGVHEVKNEYRSFPSDNPVDYGIFLGGKLSFVLEAKPLGWNISDRKCVAQTVAYAGTCGAEWAVLSNGLDWAIYNTLLAVDVERKLFVRFSLQEKSSPRYLALLGKSAMAAGEIDRMFQRQSSGRKLLNTLAAASRSSSDDLSSAVGRLTLEDIDILASSVKTLIGRAYSGEMDAEAAPSSAVDEGALRIWEGWKVLARERSRNLSQSTFDKLMVSACSRVARVIGHLRHGDFCGAPRQDEETIQLATSVLNWLFSDAISPLVQAAPPPSSAGLEGRIVHAIKQQGENGCRVRDLVRKGLGSRLKIESSLAALEKNGTVAQVQPPRRIAAGRPPSIRWVIPS